MDRRHFEPNKEGKLLLRDPVVVGTWDEGCWELLAERADIEAGETNGDSQAYNRRDGKYSHCQPLQVWFKWIYDVKSVPGKGNGNSVHYAEHQPNANQP